MSKIKVLFLCTANSARSQMAEAFLKFYAVDKYDAYSAGIKPESIHPLTKKVMDEIGVDINTQYSKSLNEYMGKIHFSYLITVCSISDSNCPTVFPGMGQRIRWNFEDPAGFIGSEQERLQKFRDIRDQIRLKIQDWIYSQRTAL